MASGVQFPPLPLRRHSSTVEHLFGKEEVPSSNLGGGSRSLSSAVELLPYKQAATGSIPVVTIGSCCADSTERRHRGATRNVVLNEESRKPQIVK